MRLIEIDRLGHVGWNDRVVLVNLRNAIHLDGKEHGDTVFFQFFGQRDGFRAAPAHSVNDDAGAVLLLNR